MLSAIGEIRRLSRLKTRLALAMAVSCLSGAGIFISHSANAGTFSGYSLPPYICTTGIGCCSAAQMPSLVHEMFSGTGMYSGQQDLQQYYYTNSLKPKMIEAFKKFKDELRNARVFSVGVRGAFIDAQNFNYTLTSLGKISTESLVNETTSDQVCRFGTLTKSLSLSEDKTKVAQLGFASQMLQRELMRSQLASGNEQEKGSQLGRTSDKLARLEQYKSVFCDPKNANGSVGGAGCTSTKDDRFNADIDVARKLITPLTLDVDFSGTELSKKTDTEEDLIAMANNLFAHNLPVDIGQADFDALVQSNGDDEDEQKTRIMDYRALVAKRTVAQNSFAALTAMKVKGSAESGNYVKEMFGYLGLDSAGQSKLLGDNPSYYAQMELLTRKIYQSPEFYASLMDSPANVARQQVAMEGIGLMQDRDIYNSLRRSEMLLSMLLEMKVNVEQDNNKDRGVK